MKLRPHFALLALVLLIGAALASSSSPVVAEEDAPASEADGQWVYDVRVVRVLGDRDLAERPAPWAESEGGSPIVQAAWPDLLKAVKARGATTIMLDQRVTALPDMAAEVKQSRTQQIQIFDRRDINNESWKAAVLNESCTVKLVPARHLEYEVNAMWTQRRSAPLTPLQGANQWRGQVSHPLRGATLVLGYREQMGLGGEEPVTFEIWVFITERWTRLR